MNIEDMIMNGASEEEIKEALDQLRAKREIKMEEERQAREVQKKKDEKEALKAEARAHFINAVLAYCEAFDLLDEEEEWTEESVKEVENYLIQIEKVIPTYIELMKKKREFGLEDLFGLI